MTYLFSQSVSQIIGVSQEVPLGRPVGNINVDVVSGHLWVTRFSGDKSYIKHVLPPHTARSPSEVQ